MGNPVVHWELMSKDPVKVSDFYAKTFGWKVTHMPEINYRLAAYRKKVKAQGGRIHVEEKKVPGMGKFSLFTDPEGRMMGLWKAKT